MYPGPGLSGGCSIAPLLIFIMFAPKIDFNISKAEATPCTAAPSEMIIYCNAISKFKLKYLTVHTDAVSYKISYKIYDTPFMFNFKINAITIHF